MISIKGLRQGLLIIFSDEHVPWLTKLRELEEKLVAGSSFFQGAQAAFDVRGVELSSDDLKRLIDLAASYAITPFAIISANEQTRSHIEAFGLATHLPAPQPARRVQPSQTAQPQQQPALPQPADPEIPAVEAIQNETVQQPPVVDETSAIPAPGDDTAVETQPVAITEPATPPESATSDDALVSSANAPETPAVDTQTPVVAAPVVTTATIAAAIAAAEENQERGTDGALIKRRVRSGQIVRHPGHIVIVGDVNPGARIEAGGDIIVWGKLQGTAHAGAFGNAKAVICALEMTPNLVKIADLIVRNHRGKAEMAAIKEQEIVFIRWESKS